MYVLVSYFDIDFYVGTSVGYVFRYLVLLVSHMDVIIWCWCLCRIFKSMFGVGVSVAYGCHY